MTTQEYIDSRKADLDKLGLPIALNRKQVTDILATGFEDGKREGAKEVKTALATAGIGDKSKTPTPVDPMPKA